MNILTQLVLEFLFQTNNQKMKTTISNHNDFEAISLTHFFKKKFITKPQLFVNGHYCRQTSEKLHGTNLPRVTDLLGHYSQASLGRSRGLACHPTVRSINGLKESTFK